ncbi:MAG TPA: PilZ domain-containing protein [Kofleriaceae bacterium]|nr:PilZ domain-containing protein [Kofleriaceae bacterium]
MDSLLASAESMSIGVRTVGGRTLEYRTELLGEEPGTFTVHVPPDLWDRLHEGQAVLIKAVLPDAFLLFETVIMALRSEPIARADLSAVELGRARRLPRRQHFRVSASLPVTFTFEQVGARVPEQVVVTLKGTTFDISSGGVGVLIDRDREPVLPAPLATGRVQITLTPLTPSGAARSIIACDGRVARLESIEHTSRVLIGVDLQDPTEAQRMEISRFVIAQQLALRRRGVLF